MPGRCWVPAVCVLVIAGVASAQPAVPPLALTPADGGLIGGGTPVSQPLQPIVGPDPLAAPTVVETVKVPAETTLEVVEAVRPLGRSWETIEYLLWWPKGHPLPPLVTAGRGPSPPALGGPNTLVLVGGGPIDSPDVSGARFTFGMSVNHAETAGLAVTYFFLGSRTSAAEVAGSPRNRSIGRPVVNPLTGAEDVIPVSVPGVVSGYLEAATTTRVTGWEVTGLASLYAGPQVRLNALAGYRYFMVNEGLRVEQTALFPARTGPAILASLADQFDAHNRFHGGQLGLSADFVRAPVFLEATGKVALGQSISVVKVSGQAVAVAPGFPFPAVQTYAGGVLGQPTNSGRYVRTAFAVLPETSVKIGYRFKDRSRVFLGYNFVYLSEAVRPGDQVDPVVDPSQVPVFGRPTPGGGLAERPGPILARSDFWVQGLVFGVEYRY